MYGQAHKERDVLERTLGPLRAARAAFSRNLEAHCLMCTYVFRVDRLIKMLTVLYAESTVL